MRISPPAPATKTSVILGLTLPQGYRSPKVLFANRELESLKRRLGKFSPAWTKTIDEPNKLNIEKVIAELKKESGWNQPYDFVITDNDPVFLQLLERMEEENLESRLVIYCHMKVSQAMTLSRDGLEKGYCGISDYELMIDKHVLDERIANVLGEEGLERLTKTL